MTRVAGRGPRVGRPRYDDAELAAIAAHASADLAELMGDWEAQATLLACYLLPLTDKQAARVAGLSALIAHRMLGDLGGVQRRGVPAASDDPAPLAPLPPGFQTVVDSLIKEHHG